jgi:hypothetical protein
MEQTEAKFVFQFDHVFTERGLRNMDDGGGAGNASCLHDLHEIAYLSELQGSAPDKTLGQTIGRVSRVFALELSVVYVTWAR